MPHGVREVTAEPPRLDILEAAAVCFMERGFAATSIDDVARRLGATKGLIYHHYPSKADLFAAVFGAGMDMNFAALGAEVATSLPAAARWHAMAATHARQMIRTKPFQRAVWEGVELHLRGATTPSQRQAFALLVERRAEYETLFRTAVSDAAAEGVFRIRDLSIAMQLMFLTLNSPIFWYSPRASETEEDVEQIVRDVVGYAARGLGER